MAGMKNETGIEYPTMEIGGTVYTLRWTPAVAYEASVAGVSLVGLPTGVPGKLSIPFHQVVDSMAILIGWQGTKHELADHIHGRTQEAYDKIVVSMGKAAPSKNPLQTPAAAAQPNPVQ